MKTFDQFERYDVRSWTANALFSGTRKVYRASRGLKKKTGIKTVALIGAMLSALVLTSPTYAQRSGKIESTEAAVTPPLSVRTPNTVASRGITVAFAENRSATGQELWAQFADAAFASPNVVNPGRRSTSLAANTRSTLSLTGNVDVSYEEPRSSVELRPSTQQFITARGFDRLRQFGRARSGWDQGTGRALSLVSVAEMDYFVSTLDEKPARVSVFMSHLGNVVLSWPIQDDQLVELEFREGSISFFFEDEEDEGVVSRSDYSALRDRLFQQEAIAA
ncbi:hypothetical protein QTI51_37410 [Variovorax sp. J22G73]|uniref:hypothetical protein n=1 Tax=unclassified Variovorax TaxID=663243 RepID=UPI0025785D65|nr:MULTISPECIES: hypothetical protein [unclassified Variovorax]MDM0010134.1 hypothetical protein [Variovorax sp. J22R203]MDM0103004.1 hypothetical protein [Variovorax sp. J22G73]